MKANSTKARKVATTTYEQLNVLMEAVALIIARRQMKQQWAGARRLTPIT